MVRGRWVDEASRLMCIDGLLKFTMKKRILHIKLMNRLGARGSNAEHNPDGSRVDDRTKGLIIVDTMLLGEATDNPASFVA